MDSNAINAIKCNRLNLSEPNSYLINSALTDFDGRRSLTESRFHNPSVKNFGNQTLVEQITAFFTIGHIRTRQWTYNRLNDILSKAAELCLLNEVVIVQIEIFRHRKFFSAQKIFPIGTSKIIFSLEKFLA